MHVITIPVTDSMGELTAKKVQLLSGSDIQFLVSFWLQPEPEPDIKKMAGYPANRNRKSGTSLISVGLGCGLG